jgi:hypothetical protein
VATPTIGRKMNSARGSTIRRLQIQLTTGAVAAALSLACGGSSTTAPSTTVVTLRAEVSDPIGDAVPVAGVSNPSDLVHGTVDILTGNVTFTVQFASATFDRRTTGVLIDLDTDRNPSTGISGGSGFGIDYVVSLWAPTNQVMIQKALANGACTSNQCFTTVGMASLIVNADGVQGTVPLALLGNGDGRLNFRVFAYYVASSSSGSPSILTDVLPDVGLPPGSVQ